jgi:hypothetical protein
MQLPHLIEVVAVDAAWVSERSCQNEKPDIACDNLRTDKYCEIRNIVLHHVDHCRLSLDSIRRTTSVTTWVINSSISTPKKG